MVLSWMLAFAPAFAQSTVGAEETKKPRSNVVGSVKREDGSPIAGAGVELLDRAGAVFARSDTSADGSYSMPCIPHGQYQMRLDTPEYRGETRRMPVGAQGVQVDWIFGTDTKRPLAVATPGGGVCAADGAIADATPTARATSEDESWWWRNRYWIGGGLVVTGVGIGVGVGAGGGGGGGGGGSPPATPSE
jgi:hypothetical protein